MARPAQLNAFNFGRYAFAKVAAGDSGTAGPVTDQDAAPGLTGVITAPAAMAAAMAPIIGLGGGFAAGGLGGAGLGGLIGGAYGAYNPGTYAESNADKSVKMKRRGRMLGALRGLAAGGAIGGGAGGVLGAGGGLAVGTHVSNDILRNIKKINGSTNVPQS